MLAAAVLAAALAGAPAAEEVRVREPAVADQFYPADPAKLAKAIDYYLKDAVEPSAQRPIAVVTPHAGYIYSGQICADAFKQAAAHDYDLVVLLGTNHTTAGFAGVSIYPGGGYQTPLGTARIDEDLAEALIAADRRFTFERAVHQREHSVEVLVPFVQTLFPEATILPAVVGMPDLDLCSRFGEVLASAIRGRRALIVASSDLSHYPDYDDAREVDRKTLDAITSMDAEVVHATLREQLRKGVPNLSTCACGAGPVMAAIVAARRLGATSARVISYANSGDASIGRRSRVVGYAAVSFTAKPDPRRSAKPSKKPATEPPESSELSDQERRLLLAFARKTIGQWLGSETVPLGRGFGASLNRPGGAFVTLTKHGALRGCIGHLEGDLPLGWVVGNCAFQAAFNDRRFSPVEPDELDDIEIEVSVLTPMQPVDGYHDILVGRDGVVIEKNGRSAVYLPSVPVEQGWDRDEMLDHLCRKAGLPPGSWMRGARFYTFQAVKFAESDHL